MSKDNKTITGCQACEAYRDNGISNFCPDHRRVCKCGKEVLHGGTSPFCSSKCPEWKKYLKGLNRPIDTFGNERHSQDHAAWSQVFGISYVGNL